jgi:sialic acid synthase SpsE
MIDPGILRRLVRELRDVKRSLGDGRKRPISPEEPARIRERRSIVAAVDIRAFERLDPWMLACRQPGSGISPGNIDKLLGMYVRRNIAKGTILQWDDLSYSAFWEKDSADPEEAEVVREDGPVMAGREGGSG